MFCFFILFTYYRKSLSPCFGDKLLMWKLMKNVYFWSHFYTNVYVKLLTKEVNLFCSWARPNISILDPFVIEVNRNIYSTEE